MSGEQQSQSRAENEDNPAHKRPANRRIDKGTIEAVAALVSRGLTESEACRQLGIRPKSYFNFKSTQRNDERFKELLEKYRAKRIEDLIAEIEKSAFGKGLKQRDWRAAKFLLEVADRNRFNTDKPAVEMSVGSAHIITLDKLEMINAMVQEELAREAKAIDCPPAKSLNEPLPRAGQE